MPKRIFKILYLYYYKIQSKMTKQPFSLKLPLELLDKVREQAKKEHRPVNNLIEVALLEYLEKVEEKEKPESK